MRTKKMLKVVFTFERLLNTSLYTIFLVYPYSCLSLLFIKIFSPSGLITQDKATYNWP